MLLLSENTRLTLPYAQVSKISPFGNSLELEKIWPNNREFCVLSLQPDKRVVLHLVSAEQRQKGDPAFDDAAGFPFQTSDIILTIQILLSGRLRKPPARKFGPIHRDTALHRNDDQRLA